MHRKSILYYLTMLGLMFLLFFASTQITFGDEDQVVSSDQVLVVKTSLPAETTSPALDLAVTAKGAVLLDGESGTFLYEHNSHEKLPPASITKIMTMLLVLEAVDRGQITLEDKVTISERAASMGGSQMYMEQGEQQKVETLLQGIF